MLRRLFLLSLLILVACADEPAPGAPSPCDTPAGPLLSCPPPGVSDPPPSIEQACARLVECGLLPVNRLDDQGRHDRDYTTCIDDLRRFTLDRLEFVLRCVDIATCDTLAQGHCAIFGGDR